MKRKTLSTLIFWLILSAQTWASQWTTEKTLFVEYDYQKDRWGQITSDERENFQILLDFLAKSNTGATLIQMAQQKARQLGHPLLDLLASGEVSYTDTTLIRKFYPSGKGDVHFEMRSRVYINRNLSLMEAVLDLAHELTHFIYRRSFNPYQKDFSLTEFITTTIEGRGGEVDAYLKECRVLFELFSPEVHKNFRCHFILDKNTGELSEEEGIKHFYQVGEYYEQFVSELERNGAKKDSFPWLSSKDPYFSSSTYGMPYPISALKEFRSVMSKACQNELKRLETIKQKAFYQKGQKTIAKKEKYFDLVRSYQQRCLNFFSPNS